MTQAYEVPEPILNSPFDEPSCHWFIREGEQPELRDGRRPAIVYPPREERANRQVPWTLTDGTLKPSPQYAPGFELALVNLIRQRLAEWRKQDYPGVTRTTHELLHHWRRPDRERRLFFAQVEAAETIIFLTEARPDLRQGIVVPRDDPSDDKKSILNKVNDRSDARFSDVVLVVCPNVTIRNRLGELDAENGEASLYRTRDLVPAHLMPKLREGKVLVMNWHVFEPQTPQAGGEPARVLKVGQPVRTRETIHIGTKTTTARGSRYLTLDDYQRQLAAGMLTVLEEERDKTGQLIKVRVESVRYIESDTAFVNRLLGREVGGKQNILVMNDEAITPTGSSARNPTPRRVRASAIWWPWTGPGCRRWSSIPAAFRPRSKSRG